MDRLDALTIFVAVAEQGSFVGAARRLGRSPAAVTRAVAALEDRLGVRLFNRTTRAVALTDEGGRHLEARRRRRRAARHARGDRADPVRPAACAAGGGRLRDGPSRGRLAVAAARPRRL